MPSTDKAMAKDNAARKRVSFSIYAPDAQEVTLAGDFNDWNPTERPLKRDESGSWKTNLSLAAGEYQYRFLVDGKWMDDPQCEMRRSNAYGGVNCVRVVK